MGLLSRVLSRSGGGFGGKYGAMARTLNRSSSRGYKPDLARIADAMMPASSRNVTPSTALGVGALSAGAGISSVLAARSVDPRIMAQGDPRAMAIMQEIEASRARAADLEKELARIEGARSPYMPAIESAEQDWQAVKDYRNQLPVQDAPFGSLERGIWPGATQERMTGELPDGYSDTGLTPEERRRLMRRP